MSCLWGEAGGLRFTYLDCACYDGLAVLDNEAEVRMVVSENQGLRANTASNIDDKRALRELSPSVPCQFIVSKVR
jgi:hypothetical protein